MAALSYVKRMLATPTGMKLRKRAPRFVRQGYRLAAQVTEAAHPSPDLPPELFEGAVFMPSREAIVASLPKGGRVLEIGTDRGTFAEFILRTAQPDRLHVVDLDYSRFRDDLKADPRVERHEGFSAEVVARFEDASFDWIYVDGGHDYPDVVADAALAARKVKPGGHVIFNDFAHIDPNLGRYGVHRAVSEFLLERRWRIHAISFHRNGLYDLSVRAEPVGTEG
ncbi:class I SAM-dependent methyltransferase [Jannaschia sp. LMIT008]|uniref:class I SAM-dependent methyltransferase n=1 Tax=Jannaschia maritima TaxID=3032585 RepID=UPI002812769D|nr:class I SAM-dependent methyltransferase [Jannaschia sp. LMIT008]